MGSGVKTQLGRDEQTEAVIWQVPSIQTEMADSESKKEIVNQGTIQAATVFMMVFRDTETGPLPAMMPNQWEN